MHAAQAETADREAPPEFADAEEKPLASQLARFSVDERFGAFRTLVSGLPRLEHLNPLDAFHFLLNLANNHGLSGGPGSETALEIEKIIGDAISSGCDGAGIDVERGAIEIPSEAFQALQSWDRILANVDRQSLARQFTRAATEILRLASPQATPNEWQQLVDNVHEMGERHGLSVKVVQTLMAAATVAPPDHRPMEESRPKAPNFGSALPTVENLGELPPGNEPDDYGSVSPIREAGVIATKALELTYFDECGAYANKQWILKGIIARGETSAWIAPPGAGKSALLTEIAVHCAAHIDWRGHRAKVECGVVVLALERGDLFKRRLRVYHQRDELAGLPIAVADAIIDLLNPSCVEIIVSTVRAAEQQFGREVGLIILDTYAKGIAASGGDEDKARDQNRAAANLRNIHAQLNVHIALVGHTGKDENRGARGSNAHVGDVDVMVQISGETIKVAQVIKGNDQPERAVAKFKLEPFELGRDEDGEPITTAIVTTEFADELTSASAADSGKKKPTLKPIPRAALRALHECIADGAASRPVDEHVPAGVTGVTMKVWRSRLEKLSIINAKGNPREQFSRIHVTLKNAGLICIWEDVVWPVT
ncbi:AAA family ATPase [Bradyrhizobium australiense]|uniref:AAA family ATPase n=1 Tax=Bradyrhizobium australiense TaxID=2721161 RepID=A0A7Y4LXZ9_9BRAD|nr:AAA family ATPase [Bradyrhizobium australiense]NOJ43018.1 AAA family ATPase [Bradyrhizobium australiense]